MCAAETGVLFMFVLLSGRWGGPTTFSRVVYCIRETGRKRSLAERICRPAAMCRGPVTWSARDSIDSAKASLLLVRLSPAEGP